MALQLDQVVEGVGSAQLAGVDQAHEQIANLRTMQGAIEQGVLAMQNRPFQGPFCDVMPPAGLCRAIGGACGPA